jgi:hypothetical protein
MERRLTCGRGVAAGAHAGVVAQPPLVQVGMIQRLRHRDPLVRVQRQHLAQQVDGLVGGGGADGVEGSDAGRLHAAAQHVALGRVARVLQVGERGRPQQVSDQVQLLDGGGGLHTKYTVKLLLKAVERDPAAFLSMQIRIQITDFNDQNLEKMYS